MRKCTIVCCAVIVFLCINVGGEYAYGLAQSTAADGSNAQAVHALGEKGKGVNVAVFDGRNANVTHVAFQDANGISHISEHDFSGSVTEADHHATFVAGVVGSRFPGRLGVAPEVNIYSARVSDNDFLVYSSYLEAALQELVINQNCRVVVTGFSLGSHGNGQSTWSLLYDYYAYHHNVIFANGTGNEAGDDPNIPAFGDAFNCITTAGLTVTDPDIYNMVGDISNRGPTSDNRRKPEVAAPAFDQAMPSNFSDTTWYTSTDASTSFAAPHTAGVAALLLGLADDTAEPDDDENEVIKAVIVNSTFPNIDDKLSNSTNPASNNAWHPERGYGRLDALRAYQTLKAARIHEDQVVDAQKGWAFGTITRRYETQRYYIKGKKNQRLRVTVTWNRSVTGGSGSYSEEPSTKFDLNLTVKDSVGFEMFSDSNSVNNLEKVDLLLPEDDTYEIQLYNQSRRRNRYYGMAFEIIELKGDFDIDYIVDYNDLAFFVGSDQWLGTGLDLEANLFIDDANNPNERVDMKDYSVFADNWLLINEAYYDK